MYRRDGFPEAEYWLGCFIVGRIGRASGKWTSVSSARSCPQETGAHHGEV